MKQRVFRTKAHVVAGLAAALMIPQMAVADYVLAPGDQLSMQVVGAPDLGAVAMIDPDGAVRLPIVGRIQAQGQTTDGLRAEIAARLGANPIRLPGGGADVWVKLDPSTLYLSIAQYRPVFAAGDVRLGGQMAFRPGMTVRQLMVMAGGIGAAAGDVSEADLIALQAERQLLLDRLTLGRADITRLEAALADLQLPTADAAPEGAKRPDLGSWREARNRLRALRTRTANLSLERMQDRLAVLEELAAVNAAALRSYEAEYARVVDLSERGVATANAVAEAERGVLSISSRALESSAEGHNLRVSMTEAAEQTALDRAVEQIDLLADLLARTAAQDEYRAQLNALDLRLRLLGGGPEPTLQVMIHRGAGSGAAQFPATLDTVIAPGDVVTFRQIIPASK